MKIYFHVILKFNIVFLHFGELRYFLQIGMGDHLLLCVDRLITPESLQSLKPAKVQESSGEGSCSNTSEPSTCVIEVKKVVEHSVAEEEEEPLIQMVECRICQEEDSIKNLEVPCACSGSLKVIYSLCHLCFLN